MGLLDFVSDALFGGVDTARKSGIYPEEGTEQLGADYNDYLSDVLSGGGPEWSAPDFQSDEEFRRTSGLYRDLITTQTGEARQRASDRAAAEGWLDSGYLDDTMMGIDRGGTQAYAQGLVGLFSDLRRQRRGEYEFDEQIYQAEIDRIFPWLGAAAGEELDVQNINIGAQLQERGQDQAFWSNVMGMGKDLALGTKDPFAF